MNCSFNLKANRELRENVRELKGKLSQVGKMTFRSPFYCAEDDEVPYCPRCWEVNKQAVHFPAPSLGGTGPLYTCPECDCKIVHPRRRRPQH